jgi:formamidopyrimidine-DNA glycosylase
MRHGAPKGFDEFIQKLPMKVREIRFHGKLLVFVFEDDKGNPHYMSNTLGMSGGWRPDHSKHGHVEFITNGGSVFFTDPRNFGTIKFISEEE